MTKTLVVGATGEVGREVVRALRERGAALRTLVRKTRSPDTEEVVGDLTDRASLERALAGCDAAVFITPHHEHEAQLGFNFVDACEAEKLRRIVFISALHPTFRSLLTQRVVDALVGLIGPHYRAKLAVERRVRATSMSPVVLNPTNFFQNDEIGLPEIAAGTYPHPLGDKPACRVDCRDIGDAAARAILDDVKSGTYALVSAGTWTGASCAALWAEALGKDVRYAGNDIEPWRKTIGARMDAARAADFGRTYKVIQRFGIPANARALARCEKILGRPPRDYHSYVTEQAAKLRASSHVSSTTAG
jgi:uncharacterized protein YbjT (DUF2867 family)